MNRKNKMHFFGGCFLIAVHFQNGIMDMSRCHAKFVQWQEQKTSMIMSTQWMHMIYDDVNNDAHIRTITPEWSDVCARAPDSAVCVCDFRVQCWNDHLILLFQSRALIIRFIFVGCATVHSGLYLSFTSHTSPINSVREDTYSSKWLIP